MSDMFEVDLSDKPDIKTKRITGGKIYSFIKKINNDYIKDKGVCTSVSSQQKPTQL